MNDPTKAKTDGPSNGVDAGPSHSGEGLASVRPGLQRTLADTARRSEDRQTDAMTSRMPNEPPPEPEVPGPARS